MLTKRRLRKYGSRFSLATPSLLCLKQSRNQTYVTIGRNHQLSTLEKNAIEYKDLPHTYNADQTQPRAGKETMDVQGKVFPLLFPVHSLAHDLTTLALSYLRPHRCSRSPETSAR